MGEYLHDKKLGTCEDLYYTTYRQLKNWNVSNKESFLKINSGYRFRFPFPDEKCKIGEYNDFDRGYLINISKGMFEINHGKTFIRTDSNLNVKAPAMGFEIDCPTQQKKYRWGNEENESLEIVQQKFVIDETSKQKELQLVLRCPYCKVRARASFDEANKIAEFLFKESENLLKSDENKANELKKIAETILEGYFPELIES